MDFLGPPLRFRPVRPGCPGVPRAIFGGTRRIFSPSLLFRPVRPGCPAVPRNCSQSHFGRNASDFHPPHSVRLVSLRGCLSASRFKPLLKTTSNQTASSVLIQSNGEISPGSSGFRLLPFPSCCLFKVMGKSLPGVPDPPPPFSVLFLIESTRQIRPESSGSPKPNETLEKPMSRRKGNKTLANQYLRATTLKRPYENQQPGSNKQ